MHQNSTFRQVPKFILTRQGLIEEKVYILKTLFILLLGLVSGFSNAQKASMGNANVDHLDPETHQQIEDILKRHRVPGAAVATIDAEGQTKLGVFGLADMSIQRPITPSTRFRVGSISKMFISLSIMKLVEQNALQLTDRLAKLAPEVSFDNPWEDSSPILIADLLAHTTGWDGTHFNENAQNVTPPVTISQAINFHPHSRLSRWVPGTRTAYNNSAPVVAAYLVEKFSGLTYEQFVERYFFSPLLMNDSGFFHTESFQISASQQYAGGKALPYRHLNNRPSGGLNSTVVDMARFAQFLLTREAKHAESVLNRNSIRMTESVQHTSAAKAGLEVNWGLGNQSFSHNGYLYYGHEGALRGAQSLIAYQPDLGVAHIILINTNSPAVQKIHLLLADIETKRRPSSLITPAITNVKRAQEFVGYYQSINPISQLTSIVAKLTPMRIIQREQGLQIGPLVGGKPKNLAMTQNDEIIQPDSGKVVLVKTIDPVAGSVLHYGPTTLLRTSAFAALMPIVLLVLWVVSGATIFLFSLVWLPRRILRKAGAGPSIGVRIWPLITCILVIGVMLLVRIILTSKIPEQMLGTLSPPSLSLMILTLVYSATSIYAIVPLIRYRKAAVSNLVYWHQSIFVVVNLLVMLCLAFYGLIGIRTWAV